MRSRTAAALLALVAAVVLAACGARATIFGREYEYEEDLTLSLDGSATVVVNASIPALATLHGLPVAADLRTRADVLTSQVRDLYTTPYSDVVRVNAWSRHGRRFVGVRLIVRDVRALPKAAPFAWARYELRTDEHQTTFRETLSKPPAGAPPPARVGLTGDETVAFRLHLPARIRFHNAWDPRTGKSRPPSRGNILTWEQRLADRRAGEPIAYAQDRSPDVMEVRMDKDSILYRTLWLFGFAFLAALAVLGGLIWLTVRRGGGGGGAETEAQR